MFYTFCRGVRNEGNHQKRRHGEQGDFHVHREHEYDRYDAGDEQTVNIVQPEREEGDFEYVSTEPANRLTRRIRQRVRSGAIEYVTKHIATQ